MWTVVYMAQDKEIADKLQQLFEQEGILVKIRPINKTADQSASVYEILVPDSEVDQAHNIIIDQGF